MRSGLHLVLPLISFVFFLVAMPVLAGDACLSNIRVAKGAEDLLVDFNVDNCFTSEMNRAIESGINTSFTFFVKLYESRRLALDKRIASIQVKHSVKYDNLKNHYELKLSENGDEIITVKDFDKVKKLMAGVEGIRVVSLESLEKGVTYRIRMMAELDKIRLPFFLHYVFFFLSLWDFETGWNDYEFTY